MIFRGLTSVVLTALLGLVSCRATPAATDRQARTPSRNLSIETRSIPIDDTPDEPELWRLEIRLRNVSDRPLPIDVRLLPIIAERDNHPFQKDHDCNLVVTVEQMGPQRVQFQQMRRELVKRSHQARLLAPGEVTTIILHVRADASRPRRDRLETAMRAGDERRPRHIWIDFAYAMAPGPYRLTATYTLPKGDAVAAAPIELAVPPRTPRGK